MTPALTLVLSLATAQRTRYLYVRVFRAVPLRGKKVRGGTLLPDAVKVKPNQTRPPQICRIGGI